MKTTKGLVASTARHESRRARLAVALACLLLPMYFLYATKTAGVMRSIVNFQASAADGGAADQEKVLVVDGEDVKKKDKEEGDLHGEKINLESPTSNNTAGESTTRGDGIQCDFSDDRYDVCEVDGDVRVHGVSSSIVLASSDETASFKIRPYSRKWERHTMQRITEFTLSSSSSAAPPCDVRHAAPAVVFSTGGFGVNFYHEVVDALIPLFETSHRFDGDVHLLVKDHDPRWIAKYGPAIKLLTKHEIVNLDEDRRVHCFPHATVGLRNNKEMGIDQSKAPTAPSMLDFKALLRRGFGLPREFVLRPKPRNPAGRKPRLLLLSRKGSRVLVNEAEVVRLVRRLGYKVVTASPEQTKNLTTMARLVNSCDVLLGVHGAGLTNMVFLPVNATMVQIIPWGEMQYPCRWSYGEPAIGMGLKYVEYEIKLKESSLIKQYPKDDAVLRDPKSIHRQGFTRVWQVFLHQDVTVNVARFRELLSREIGF